MTQNVPRYVLQERYWIRSRCPSRTTLAFQCTPAEYEVEAPNLPFTDRQCDPLCPEKQVLWPETLPPPWHSCVPIVSCREDQWEVAPPDPPFTNRSCALYTPTCDTQTSYECVAPDWNRDRECCPLRVCGPGEFESTSPSYTTNRECTSCDPPCTSNQIETVPCTPTTNRVCTDVVYNGVCPQDQFLFLDECSPCPNCNIPLDDQGTTICDLPIPKRDQYGMCIFDTPGFFGLTNWTRSSTVIQVNTGINTSLFGWTLVLEYDASIVQMRSIGVEYGWENSQIDISYPPNITVDPPEFITSGGRFLPVVDTQQTTLEDNLVRLEIRCDVQTLENNFTPNGKDLTVLYVNYTLIDRNQPGMKGLWCTRAINQNGVDYSSQMLFGDERGKRIPVIFEFDPQYPEFWSD